MKPEPNETISSQTEPDTVELIPAHVERAQRRVWTVNSPGQFNRAATPQDPVPTEV